MNVHGVKCSMSIWFFVFFFVFSPVVMAQFDSYEQYPRMRSYLQRPVSETDIDVQDVSIPRITGEGAIGEEVEELPEEQPLEISPYKEILFDKTVDPSRYIIGPGDIISLYLWGELDKEYTLRVTPEGKLLISIIGAVKVADYTLTEAEEIINNAISKKYKSIETSISLVRPRRFRLYISGLVYQPGMHESHPLERVSDVIERAGLIYRAGTTGQVGRIGRTGAWVRTLPERQTSFMQGGTQSIVTLGGKRGSSIRTIKIHRKDKIIDVDLLRFLKLGDVDCNPYVSSGDRIEVRSYVGDITVFGEVNDPGIYEFNFGDRISDLISFGGGLTSLADTSQALLVRFAPDGSVHTSTPIDLYDAVYNDPDSFEYKLNESDRLYVKTKYNYKENEDITLNGQVKFPGEYAIIPHVTKLTDVIRMAGGFTDYANLEESRIIRASTSATRDLEFERLRTMGVSEMSDEEYEYFKHRSRTFAGMITIDFVKLFEENDLSQDIVIENRDDIFIPLKRELINVLGAVEEPGFVKVEQGKDVNYYIEQVGGYTWNAKARSVRIIKAKTGQRLKPGKGIIIEGGDIIHVPEKRPVKYWEVFRDSAQIFANVATILILSRKIVE